MPWKVAIPDPNHPKIQLRSEMRRILRGGEQDSEPVCRQLERWLQERPSLKTLGVFSALPGEVDLSGLVARHPDRCWVYPRVRGDELAFHAVENPDTDLIPGAFGIREPRPDLSEVPVESIDAFFCPGLAFDKHGGRLGRGKGFYDRLLANARPDALKVGVCFPWQVVDDTFAEPHDITMDAVVF